MWNDSMERLNISLHACFHFGYLDFLRYDEVEISHMSDSKHIPYNNHIFLKFEMNLSMYPYEFWILVGPTSSKPFLNKGEVFLFSARFPIFLLMESEATFQGGRRSSGGAEISRLKEVKAWLTAQFDSAGREVPEFEYTPRSVAHLHEIASLSQSRTRAASIVAADLQRTASDYRSQGLINSNFTILMIDREI